MQLTIRKERKEDFNAVFTLINKAFESLKMSDHQEQFLVERLRKSKAFVPDLSLVVETDNIIVGHVLLTKLKIKNAKESFESLALAPISILPEYQNKGIGGKLITYAHELARDLGYKSVVLLGHEKYYPKFGYLPADNFGIEFPFDGVPKENCMVIELVEGGLGGVSGKVEYPEEFNI